jgi:hypothetical protein
MHLMQLVSMPEINAQFCSGSKFEVSKVRGILLGLKYKSLALFKVF